MIATEQPTRAHQQGRVLGKEPLPRNLSASLVTRCKYRGDFGREVRQVDARSVEVGRSSTCEHTAWSSSEQERNLSLGARSRGSGTVVFPIMHAWTVGLMLACHVTTWERIRTRNKHASVRPATARTACRHVRVFKHCSSRPCFDRTLVRRDHYVYTGLMDPTMDAISTASGDRLPVSIERGKLSRHATGVR